MEDEITTIVEAEKIIERLKRVVIYYQNKILKEKLKLDKAKSVSNRMLILSNIDRYERMINETNMESYVLEECLKLGCYE